MRKISFKTEIKEQCDTPKSKVQLAEVLGDTQALELTLARMVKNKDLYFKDGMYCIKYITNQVQVRQGSWSVRNRQRVLEQLSEPKTVQELCGALHMTISPVRLTLAELVELNLIRNVNGKFERI